MQQSDKWVVIAIVGAIGATAAFIALDSWWSARSKSSSVDLDKFVAPAPPPTCVLSLPGSSGGPLAWPSEEGLTEFEHGAAARLADRDLVLIATANGAMRASHGTRCSWIEQGFSHSKVRLLDGPHVGEVFWVASSHTHGR